MKKWIEKYIKKETCNCHICGKQGVNCDTPFGEVIAPNGVCVDISEHLDVILCADKMGNPICNDCAEDE